MNSTKNSIFNTPDIVTLANGLCFGALLCLMPAARPIAIGIVLLVLGVMIIGNKILAIRRNEELSPYRSWPFVLGVLLCIIYIGRQYAQDALLFAREGRGYDAIDYSVKNLALLFGVVGIGVLSRDSRIAARIASLCIGVGMYAGINLLIFAFDIPIGDATKVFDESRFGFAEYRWLPPYTRSNGTFAMTCTVAALIGMVVLLHSFKHARAVGGELVRVPLSIAVLLAATASIACQFRAHLLAVICFGAWIVLKGRLRVALLIVVTLWFIFAPVVFRGQAGSIMAQSVGLDFWLERIGSNLSEIFTLSGRTYIYDYAWDRLSIPEIAMWGEGPSFRDSGIATVIQGTSQRGVSYHSGLLDLLLSHGAFFAAALATVIIFSIKRLLAKADVDDADFGVSLPVAYLVFWLALSGIDGGFASSFEVYVLATIPVTWSLWGTPRVARRPLRSMHQIHPREIR